jgi:hypothetical protein
MLGTLMGTYGYYRILASKAFIFRGLFTQTLQDSPKTRKLVGYLKIMEKYCVFVCS